MSRIAILGTPIARVALICLCLAVAFAALLRTDLRAMRWAEALSEQGSPPPERDAYSPTGYARGERFLLATHERGETYRWIQATQDLLSGNVGELQHYDRDTPPAGRPQLLSRLYLYLLGGIAHMLHAASGEPVGLCAERAGLWEPVISHALIWLALVGFVARRHGGLAALATGLFLALFPPISTQFIPGVLTPRPWAMALSALALALHLPPQTPRPGSHGFGWPAALCTGLALGLDPAFGFAVVIATALIGAISVLKRKRISARNWALVGAMATLAVWLLDGAVWPASVGELRCVHPFYALAWLGLGLGLDAWQRRASRDSSRALTRAELAAAALLLTPLLWTQVHGNYPGWLYPSPALRRISSLQETAFAHLPLRWSVVAAMLLIPVLWNFASAGLRRAVFGLCLTAFVAALVFDSRLPAALHRPTGAELPGPRDLEVLIHRHFAHWVATHGLGKPVVALAPPELADSLVYHGGCTALMSTAWESYPGLVAASRILSAPEASEAEAVLQSHGITHLVLTSWDTALPLLVRRPVGEATDTLYARLQRWLLPLYLRPVPYHLPAIPGFETQKLALFKVTAPQDEALALGRLAEYFLEMDRPEPAGLAAAALAESFPNDPNATIARALVYAHARKSSEFQEQLARLISDVRSSRPPPAWDRRVQRAIVLALGHEDALARSEVEACVATANSDNVADLTPLQAYRLSRLAEGMHARFATPEVVSALASLGAEYARR